MDNGPLITNNPLNPYGPVIIDANGNYWFEQPLSGCGLSPVSGVLDNTGSNLAGPFYVLGVDLIGIYDYGLCRASVSSLALNGVSLSGGVLTLTDSDVQAAAGRAPGTPPDTVSITTTFTLSQEPTPSLQNAAGNWTLFDGSILTITQDGTLTWNDTNQYSTCSVNGTVTISDPATDVYTVTGTISTPCTVYDEPAAKASTVTGVFTIDASGQMHGGLTAGIMIPLDSAR